MKHFLHSCFSKSYSSVTNIEPVHFISWIQVEIIRDAINNYTGSFTNDDVTDCINAILESNVLKHTSISFVPNDIFGLMVLPEVKKILNETQIIRLTDFVIYYCKYVSDESVKMSNSPSNYSHNIP